MGKLRIYTMMLGLCMLGFVPLSSAQVSAPVSVKSEVKHSFSPADLISTKKQLAACVVSANPGASSFKRCGDLRSTAISSQGIQVALTGGRDTHCTSVTLANGDSVNSCLTNGISVVQVCKQQTGNSGGQHLASKTESKCEDFVNGEKQIQ